MTITLTDVARQAGVSTAAVSNALRKNAHEAGVRESTHARILAAAAALGYQANPFAASLRTRRTRTIGLFLPEDTRSYFHHPNHAAHFSSLVAHIGRLGYRITLLSNDWTSPPDARLMDGCIFLGWIPLDRVKEVERLAERIPVLSASRPIKNAVQLLDNPDAALTSAARLAAGYLYDRGHRRLALVDVKHPDKIDTYLMTALEQVARERRLKVHLHLFGDRWQERRYPTIPEILALSPPPTAVIALDDDYARVLIDHLAQQGKRVPRNLSVFSGNTSADGFQSVPPLTGIAFDREPQLKTMIEGFLEIVEGRSTADLIRLPPPSVQLIERQSCRPIKVIADP
jgi:DNA-binding LacI/PurR family transcriptional regulator